MSVVAGANESKRGGAVCNVVQQLVGDNGTMRGWEILSACHFAAHQYTSDFKIRDTGNDFCRIHLETFRHGYDALDRVEGSDCTVSASVETIEVWRERE